MRTALILCWLLAISISGLPQQAAPPAASSLTKEQVHSLSLLGELWGFLKYYHPAVAKGTQDWDSVLIKKIPLYLHAQKQDDIDRLTASWLRETGMPPVCRQCDNAIPDSLTFNLDLTWINEQNFSREITGQLLYIRDNRNQGGNRYVSLQSYRSLETAEKTYNSPAFLYPSAEYRLLLLFRYWNIVHYFSPYKYICGRDWKEVLREQIPVFYTVADTLAYQLAYVKLVNMLNDGHSIFWTTPVLQCFWGKGHFPPFHCKYIGGQMVVSTIYNDSLAALIHIRLGDVITEINHEKVTDKIKRLKDYIPASNEAGRLSHFTGYFLFADPDSSFIIKKIRNGREITDSFVMPRYITAYPDTVPWRMLEGNIGYVNMAFLKVPEVDKMMRAMENTRGIIFDLRNYPENTDVLLARYLSPRPFVMGRISAPDMNYPGVFRFQKQYQYGRANHHAYAGKVVILADEVSVSHSEFSVMVLQAAAPHAMTIGSTTAGQDGDVSTRIWLPGGYFTRFSSLGIYYPDGTIAQRKGVRIDKTVIPTIKGLQEGRDEVLEAGVAYIKTE